MTDNSTQIHQLSAGQLSASLASGDLSAEEITRTLLERISSRDEQLKAWTVIDETALAQAKELDRQPRRSPIHGIPVAIKDVIDTAGLPTSRGSAIHSQRRPSTDAAAVTALREAGAVVLGKTVTTEFAAHHPGATRNPHDLDRTPGGSSSGSAAAVADGMVPFAIGTQTAGSVVRPAAYCGVVGMKPTFGSWSMRGVQPLAPSFDTLGSFSRTVDDVDLFWPYLGGSVTGRRAPTGPVRLAYGRTPFWDQLSDGVAARYAQFFEDLASGVDGTAEATLPAAAEDLVEAQKVIYVYEAAQSLSWEYTHHHELLSDFMQSWIDEGRRISDAQYLGAKVTRLNAAQTMSSLWDTTDVLVMPATVDEAPQGLDFTGDPLLCRPWSALGLPTISIPLLTGPSGMPLGVQLVGPAGEDSLVVQAARQLAAAFGSRPAG